MRLNEFQAHVVRNEQITGLVEQSIVNAVEKSVGEMLCAAARLAQSVGSDLDSIGYEAVKRLGTMPAAVEPATGRIVP